MRLIGNTCVGVLLSGLVLSASSARADTYVVNSVTDAVDAVPGNGTCATAAGACTLRAAVQEANAHAGADTITLPSGLYLLSLIGAGEDLAATGDLDVTDELQVNGAAQATTIVDGLSNDRLFQATAMLTLRDLTLRRGSQPAGDGGALHLALPGTKTLERVLVTGNIAVNGGGIVQTGGDLALVDSTVERNVATADGGGLILGGAGSLTITNGTFASNVAQAGSGGAVRSVATGTVTVTNATFSENIATMNGAGLYASGCAMASVSGTTFDGNVAVGAAGALILQSTGNIAVSSTTVTNNFALQYAGIYLTGATVTMTGGEVSDNSASAGFGGMYLISAMTASVDGTVFRRNSGGGGPIGGLVASGAGGVTIANVEASDNSATLGGGIYAAAGAGAISISRTRVLNNGAASGQAGGLFVAGSTVTISDSTISGNVSAGFGGGIFASAAMGLSLQGTTVSANRAAGVSGTGGGIFASTGAASVISNTTISGNIADVQGGGIYSAGDFALRNLTLVDNDAPTGSAVYNAGGTVTPTSTIVAGAAPSHCAGAALVSGGNNIDSTGTCGLAGVGDQTADPQLGPLADNGGATLTHLPAPTSPALDAGAAAGCPATDQRGETRPTDGNGDGTAACDVGAVEFLDLCLADPAKVLPGICGCGVADTDATFANGTADCLINGELKARIARAKTIIAALAGDADPLEAELGTIGESLPAYVSQYKAQIQLTDPNAKVDKFAKKARKKVKKVGKAKAGAKLDKAKTKATTALDALDAAVAPQA